jgi:hypothetical protein
LNLKLNVIQTIFPVKEFAHLSCINISDNYIDSWLMLNAFDKFPGLTDVRLGKNPIHRASGSLLFQVQSIARVGKLEKLNGSTIATKDRVECEIYYVNMCARQRSEMTESALADFDLENPRFLELAKSKNSKQSFSDI